MKDWRGVDIEIGSRVVYYVQTSTSVYHMAEGVVEAFPPLEARQRLPRATVRIVRESRVYGYGRGRNIPTNRLTVVDGDSS